MEDTCENSCRTTTVVDEGTSGNGSGEAPDPEGSREQEADSGLTLEE